MKSVSRSVSPCPTEKMPKANATEKYPRQMGIPETIPFLKLLLSKIKPIIVVECLCIKEVFVFV
jgi:hypothetical protein